MTMADGRYTARPWGERLRAWREEVKHWSRAELRDQIEAASHKVKEPRGHKLDERLIARWEKGDVKRPQAFYCRLLEYVGAPFPCTATESNRIIEDEDDMNRRRFLLNAGTAGAAAVATLTMSYGGRPIPERIDSAHVRELRSTIDGLYRDDQIAGGAGLAKSALHQYDDARYMLDEADYQDSIGRELTLIAGELAVCAGWLSYDSDNQKQSRGLYSEALLLAEQAGDIKLAIQAMEKMTLQTTFIAYRGRRRGAAREAVRLSNRVADLARHESSSRLHALLAGRQAIAYAIGGDEREFREAMTRAWREIDRSGRLEQGAETWLQFVTPGEILVHEAKGYMYLGKPAGAVRLYRESLEDSGLSARNRLNYRAQLSGSLALLGDNMSAMDEGMAVLPLLENAVASPRTLAELLPVRRIANDLGNTDFCERHDRAIAGNGVRHDGTQKTV